VPGHYLLNIGSSSEFGSFALLMATGYTHISIPATQNPLLSPENVAVVFGMASV